MQYPVLLFSTEAAEAVLLIMEQKVMAEMEAGQMHPQQLPL